MVRAHSAFSGVRHGHQRLNGELLDIEDRCTTTATRGKSCLWLTLPMERQSVPASIPFNPPSPANGERATRWFAPTPHGLERTRGGM